MMAFRCPQSGRDVNYKGFSTKLGQIFGWACMKCDVFLSSREIEKLLYVPWQYPKQDETAL